jgi:hypothetical protein
VRLLLRRTLRLAFLSLPTRADPNEIVLRIDPGPGLRLQLSALAAAVAARGPLTGAARHRGSAVACSWTSGW